MKNQGTWAKGQIYQTYTNYYFKNITPVFLRVPCMWALDSSFLTICHPHFDSAIPVDKTWLGVSEPKGSSWITWLYKLLYQASDSWNCLYWWFLPVVESIKILLWNILRISSVLVTLKLWHQVAMSKLTIELFFLPLLHTGMEFIQLHFIICTIWLSL